MHSPKSCSVKTANIGIVLDIVYTDPGWRGEEIITTIAVGQKGEKDDKNRGA